MAKTLDDIFNDDDFGLLNSKDQSLNIKTDEDRLIDSFEEVNSFFEKNNREPSTGNMSEYNLLARLKSFRENEDKKKVLKPFDRFDLLGYVELEIKTLDQVLEDDELGLLDSDADNSIFEFNHTPRNDKRADADFVAQRQSISEKAFKKYETMFYQVHEELKTGKRKLLKFENFEKNLQIGNFYLLDGMLLFLESADLQHNFKELRSGDRLRIDGRTVTIFENGTKSNMLFRSLGKSIQKNGKLITLPVNTYQTDLQAGFNFVAEEDIQSGWIYVLKSKSTNPKLSNVENLYKIGFSKLNVVDRIKNASDEATYLYSDVEIVATYRCYNINTQNFENLIHRFFAKCCLNIDVYDKIGTRYMPREWFIVPVNIIEEVVHLIISGEIIKYKYNEITMRLEDR